MKAKVFLQLMFVIALVLSSMATMAQTERMIVQERTGLSTETGSTLDSIKQVYPAITVLNRFMLGEWRTEFWNVPQSIVANVNLIFEKKDKSKVRREDDLKLSIDGEVIPNDPMFADQNYLQQIRATYAWNYTTGSSAVIVGIIDTGTDIDNPELAPNIWVNQKLRTNVLKLMALTAITTAK